jgi:hypothetical protein
MSPSRPAGSLKLICVVSIKKVSVFSAEYLTIISRWDIITLYGI